MELTATVAGAARPGGRGAGQDRWTATGSALVVLDGATAVEPGTPPADAYVTELSAALSATLANGADTRQALRESITYVARRLDLSAGTGPSSTVLLVQISGGVAELAVLGDSTAVIGLRDGRTDRVTDDRITRVAPDLRRRYRERLRAGHGFDETHAALLREIQQAERAARNRPGGFWVAEADPDAAEHAAVRRYPADHIAWCVLATDGAQRPYDYRQGDWSALRADVHPLRRCLDQLHEWEAHCDPDGRLLPRSKRHDDKTLVVWRP
jgi:hypothetical protein